jgi:hypothetical protein
MRELRRAGVGLVLVAALMVGLVSLVEADPVENFKTVFATDVAYAGYGGMRGGDGTGTLSLSGVSGTVTEAYLYWHGPTNSDDPAANAGITFNGSGITGTQIGFASSNCWGFTNSQGYRADVTSMVSGNGDYSLANMIKADADINGASLIVFYDDGDAGNNRDIVLFDGNDSNQASVTDPADWDITLDGINYTAGSVGVDLHVSDGQAFADMGLEANGLELAPAGGANWEGNTVPNGPTAGVTNGGLWDIASYDVTSIMTPGPNTINMVTLPGGTDCLSLIVAAVNLPAGSAPNQPPTTTTTTEAPAPPPVAPAPAPVARPVAVRPTFTG